MWRNVFGDSVAAVTPFRREVERIVARRGVKRAYGTFSDWTPSEVEHAAAEVDALGGRVTEHYSSWLISAIPARGDA